MQVLYTQVEKFVKSTVLFWTHFKIHVKIIESIERELRSETYHGTRVHNKFLIISRESKKIAQFDIMIFEKSSSSSSLNI
jgi:hypothetical protein